MPFPTVYYAHPTAIFDDLDLDIVSKWEALLKGKLLVQPFGPDVQKTETQHQLRSLLFAAIIDITDSHDITVCAPKARPTSKRAPFSFLIYNISNHQAQTLLKRQVWSLPTITFSVTTLNPICPKYMFTIQGLTTMDKEEVYNSVNEVWHNQTSLLFLQQICQTYPDDLHDQVVHRLQRLVSSLELNRLDTKLRGNTIAPAFNIYADGPLIENDKTWTRIRNFYTNHVYALKSQDLGRTVVAPYHCTICHLVDHPQGLCPFPLVENWNGPKRQDTTPRGPGGFGPY